MNQKKQLFYLEDDQALAQVTVRGFTKRGFDVRYFQSIEEVPSTTDLSGFTHALLDLKLEDGHSLPLIEALSNANKSTKILVLTGYASVATAVKAVKLGADNYLAKPATIDQIMQAFDEYEDKDKDKDTMPEVVGTEEKLSLRRLEWEHIQQVLSENNGNVSLTARALKMHRRTLQRKLKKKPAAE